MADIGPGDFVECIDASPSTDYGLPTRLVQGGVYQVAETKDHPIWGTPGVRLVGIQSWNRDNFYKAARFRPVYRPRTDLIGTLLAPAPELEPA